MLKEEEEKKNYRKLENGFSVHHFYQHEHEDKTAVAYDSYMVTSTAWKFICKMCKAFYLQDSYVLESH